MAEEAKLRDIAARIRIQARVMAATWIECRGGSKEHFDFVSAAHRGHFNDLAAEIEALLAKVHSND